MQSFNWLFRTLRIQTCYCLSSYAIDIAVFLVLSVYWQKKVRASTRKKAQLLNSCFRVNWLNKDEHGFEHEGEEFEGHFGMENCLIHAKDIISKQEFVYYTKQEKATGSYWINRNRSKSTSRFWILQLQYIFQTRLKVKMLLVI